MTCNLCPLSVDKQVPGFGDANAKLIVVGEYPNGDDENTGLPFSVGRKGNGPNLIIHNALSHIGLDTTTDVFMAYALRCNPWHQKEPIKVKPPYRRTCLSQHLEQELKAIACDIILAMGDEAMKTLLPDLGGSLAHNRGLWHEAVIGGRKRFIRLTYACSFIQKMSLFKVEEKPNGRIVQTERWNPPGSCGWFFGRDILAIKKKLQEQGAL